MTSKDADGRKALVEQFLSRDRNVVLTGEMLDAVRLEIERLREQPQRASDGPEIVELSGDTLKLMWDQIQQARATPSGADVRPQSEELWPECSDDQPSHPAVSSQVGKEGA